MSQPKPRTELRTFRSLTTLRVLNVIAVGGSLASAVGAGLAALPDVIGTDHLALPSACSTLVFGMVWATLLRFRRRVAGTPLRWGWLASIPVTATNAAVAHGMFFLNPDEALSTFGRSKLSAAPVRTRSFELRAAEFQARSRTWHDSRSSHRLARHETLRVRDSELRRRAATGLRSRPARPHAKDCPRRARGHRIR